MEIKGSIALCFFRKIQKFKLRQGGPPTPPGKTMKMLSSTIVVGEQKMSFETHFFPKWERTKNYLRDSNEFNIDSLLGTKKMSLVRKVSTRLCFLRQLKKSHVITRELLLFYITCIRSILEYGSPVFHRAPTSYQSEDLERLDRAMKIIYPELSYAKALELSRLLTLYDRRGAIAAKLFDEICANQSHSLHKLLPRKD